MTASGRGEVVLAGRPELDLAAPMNVAKVIEKLAPDVVINAAAYTMVDRAESERDLAFAINRDGARAVAMATAELGLPLVHLSTDYVFRGDKESSYVEDDAPNPQSVYGLSKLAGEEAVAAVQPRHTIVRTAWVYSSFGTNFVKAMLRLAQTKDKIGVVADQLGNPTSALDLADGLMAMASRMAADSQFSGVYHVTGGGETSWFGFARHIFEISRGMGGPSAEVYPIATADYPTAARRPLNSRLDCSKFARDLGLTLPQWRPASAACIAELLQNPPVAKPFIS